MTPDALFSLANTAVLPGWLILIFAPRRWAALNAIPAYVLPFAISLIYTVLILTHFSSAGGGYGSIAEVRQLFSVDGVLVAGWVHYLAFDLFIGAWAAHRMDHAGISRMIQGVVLPCIFLFGPAGFVLALGIEALSRPLPQFATARKS